MKAILICPAERSAMALVSGELPLANMCLLGQTLLEYWLSHFSARAAESVLVLANDRPELAAPLVASGARWGLSARIAIERRELTPSQALLKYGAEMKSGAEAPVIEVLDHFPKLSQHPLFNSYGGLFEGLQAWIPRAVTPDRVGMRQVRPGIWISSSARISPQARLQAPCWVGQHVVVGPGAILGPGTMVEDGAVIGGSAEILASWIAPHTFVGRLARVTQSIASGNQLVNWQTGSVTSVPDPFVLSSLGHARPRGPRTWIGRLAELCSGAKAEPSLPWNGLIAPEEELTHERCPEH